MKKDLQSLHGVDLVDALLADWPAPAPERSAAEWDDYAEAIMGKLDAKGTEEEEETDSSKILLAPTLKGAKNSGAEAPVSHPLVPALLVGLESDTRKLHLEESMGATSPRSDRRSSLQDLAKLANEGPRSLRGGNGPDSFAAPPMSQRSSGRVSEGSGVVDLQSLASLPDVPASQMSGELAALAAGAQNTPSSDVFPKAPSSTAVQAVPSEATPSSMQESVPPMPLSIAPATLSDSGITHQPVRRMSGPGVGVIAGGIVGVLAVAAGALFFVASKKPAQTTDTASASAQITPATPVTPAAETAAVAPVAEAAQAGNTEEAPKPSDGTLDPSALPVNGATATAGATAGSHHSSHSSGTAVAAAAPAAPTSKESKKEAEKAAKEEKAKGKTAVAAAEPAAPSGIPDNALGNAMKQASGGGVVGSGVKDDAAPAFAAGTVPQRPSQGTLTSALGRVLGKAKACIGPDDPISRASVVFGSAGTVQSVAVSGNAAGKPAEACIKSALSGAKLNTPFAEPTYTTTVTIRP